MIDEKLLEEALTTINRLNNKMADINTEKKANQDVAVVGMSCRLPGAPDLQAFWRNLCEGVDAVDHYPEERLSLLGLGNSDVEGGIEQVYGGYLKGLDLFDAPLFGLSPREARCMDPQQRLLLMDTHQALLDANIMDKANFNKTGVFISHYGSQYLHFDKGYDQDNALLLATGNAMSISANRISYHYNLNGPSMMLDTACSSSLVGLDIACRYLNDGVIDYAIVGAASLNLNPKLTKLLQDAGMLSPQGRCKTFDENANGYVPGEGVGVVVLRRLKDAVEQGSPVWSVIGGTAVDQDGKSNGLTAPNGWAQEQVIQQAYKTAGVKPEQVQYVETHGTGTYLGDPVEMEALNNVLGPNRTSPCVLGCLKTNIGHLEPAAGIAGLIKASLCLHQQQIPANNHLNTINPLLRFNPERFTLPTQNIPWQQAERLAGVSAFGFGGVNGHVLLRNAPEALSQTQRLEQYSLHPFKLKSYWLKSEIPATQTSFSEFLAYECASSPTEFLRVALDIDRWNLPGIGDTGNFHIGFYIETIYKVFSEHFNLTRLTIDRVDFLRLLFVSKQVTTQIQVLIEKTPTDYQLAFHFKFDAPKSTWVLAATATVSTEVDQLALASPERSSNPGGQVMSEQQFYEQYEGMGYPGMGFVRVIESCTINGRSSDADLRLSFDPLKYKLGVHPGFLDAVLQPGFVMLDATSASVLYMTSVMENIRIYRPLSEGRRYHLHNHLPEPKEPGTGQFQMDWHIVDDSGEVYLSCGNATLQRLTNDEDALDNMTTFDASRHQQLTPALLLGELAKLLEAEVADIDPQRELLELGMDSLMIMKLQAILDQFELPINNLFEMTVADLLEVIDGQNQVENKAVFGPPKGLKPYSLARNDWVRGKSKPQARIKLYCFPYGHSSSAIFRNWVKSFPDEYEVCPIELPGRGDRLKERPLEDAMEIAAYLTEMLGDELEQPFALYGHSAGTLLAYAWCLYLRDKGKPMPVCLFASAFTAPCITNPVVENLKASYQKFSIDHIPTLDEILSTEQPGFVDQVIDVLEDTMHEEGLFSLSRELIHAQVHSIVSAFRMVAGFDPKLVSALDIPIAALHGEAEGQVTLEEMQAWQQLTTKDFSLKVFSGDHLFMDPDQNEAQVISHVIGVLERLSQNELMSVAS